MMIACTIATVAPPNALPIATAQRGTGATSTSFRNPNSRSQMIDSAEKIDVNRMLIEITPGYRNWMYPTLPARLSRMPAVMPLPRMSRYRSGWPIIAMMRAFSRQNVFASRSQIV